MTATEKRRFEKLLDMGGGYVLDFTNRTFGDLVMDAIGRDIYDESSGYHGSKATRLRALWTSEPDHLVARVLADLLGYFKETGRDSLLFDECVRTVERLKQRGPVEDLSALEPNAEGRDFEALAKSIREAVQGPEPEAGLDRLHTFVVKYVRVLAQRQGIDIGRDKPLHSLFGEYLKSLRRRGLVETVMSERILKSTISILEAFNEVRNDRTLAHDNPLLSSREALLIFTNVASAIRFISAIEEAAAQPAGHAGAEDEVPF